METISPSVRSVPPPSKKAKGPAPSGLRRTYQTIFDPTPIPGHHPQFVTAAGTPPLPAVPIIPIAQPTPVPAVPTIPIAQPTPVPAIPVAQPTLVPAPGLQIPIAQPTNAPSNLPSAAIINGINEGGYISSGDDDEAFPVTISYSKDDLNKPVRYLSIII